MVDLSIKNVRAQFLVLFIIGVILLVLGIYGLYHAVVTGFTGSISSSLLPYASLGSIAVGFLMIAISYKIFVPLKRHKRVEE
jgi:hypothetical protein